MQLSSSQTERSARNGEQIHSPDQSMAELYDKDGSPCSTANTYMKSRAPALPNLIAISISLPTPVLIPVGARIVLEDLLVVNERSRTLPSSGEAVGHLRVKSFAWPEEPASCDVVSGQSSTRDLNHVLVPVLQIDTSCSDLFVSCSITISLTYF